MNGPSWYLRQVQGLGHQCLGKQTLTCGQPSLSKLGTLNLDLPNSQTDSDPVNICGVVRRYCRSVLFKPKPDSHLMPFKCGQGWILTFGNSAIQQFEPETLLSVARIQSSDLQTCAPLKALDLPGGAFPTIQVK